MKTKIDIKNNETELYRHGIAHLNIFYLCFIYSIQLPRALLYTIYKKKETKILQK